MAIEGQNIVCLSSQDFDDLWTRKQRWMTRLARHNRVFWVNLQMHVITYLRNFPQQHRSPFGRKPRQVSEQMWVYTPPTTIPFYQMSSAVCRAHNVALNCLLRRRLQQLGFTGNILWLYTPYNAYQIGRLFDDRRIYECVDDFSAARGLIRAGVVRRLETATLRSVDQVIVTAERLAEKFAGRTRRLLISPNAADFEHFHIDPDRRRPDADELRDVTGPVIGFLGSVSYWVDVELIAALARAKPDWTFVLVGPLRTSIQAFAAVPNVRLVGQRPYADLPRYLQRFDVCLNPYRNDAVAEGASPLKLYEYLASGKPVVSSDMPEARRFADVVSIAHTPDEFITAIGRALAENGSRRRQRQLVIARDNGWEKRFEELERQLEPVLMKRPERTSCLG